MSLDDLYRMYRQRRSTNVSWVMDTETLRNRDSVYALGTVVDSILLSPETH